MLEINLFGELFDDATQSFIQVEPRIVRLEHSLLSMSKWESEYELPLLSSMNKEGDAERILKSYVKFMVIGPPIADDEDTMLWAKHRQDIILYINKPHTATKIVYNDRNIKKKPKKQTVTSEIIYYWMMASNIPLECEKWHLNRLLTLLEVFSVMTDNKKLSQKESMIHRRSLNQARRAAAEKARG